jgi:hypothetical protein
MLNRASDATFDLASAQIEDNVRFAKLDHCGKEAREEQTSACKPNKEVFDY